MGAWLAATGSARGYVRREPSQAAAYLRGVGLAGPFWGL